MTAYAPSAFGADQITSTILSDAAALEILKGIPTSKTIADYEQYEDGDMQDWLKNNFVTEQSLENDDLSFSLEHPETNELNRSKVSYRGRFMRGKENEYAATVEAYHALYGSGGDGHLDSLRQCRKFANFKREKVSGEVKVFSSACRERWCPMCSGQKASFAKEQTQQYIESLKTARFLTLTLRNNDSDLKSQIDFLTMSFRTLRQRAYWKKNVTGGIWFLQIKRGTNSGCWHPHLHILIDGNSMVQGRLSELWEQVTYGSPIIDIRKVSNAEEVAKYVARYCARPAVLKDMPLLDRVEVISALFRKRLCGAFGTGKTVTLTPPKIAADGEWSDIGYYDEVVRQAKTDPAAKKILQAYFNDDVLTEEDFKDFTGKPVWGEVRTYEVKENPQMWLDFYT